MDAKPDQLPRRFGKYQLVRQVATGGMAELFLAIEMVPGVGRRFVIIKRIRPEHVTDTDYVEFFLTEGRVALRCAHANLPQTYELAKREGAPYLAMEYIRGHTLLDAVNKATAAGHQLSTATVLRIGIEVASALEHLHTLCDVDGNPLSVVHRDVTPQNVMLSGDGTVKLIDLGIVRSSIQTHRTQAGVVKGKFSYLAPEALERGKRVDHRADLFSLGIVLHESLTGRSLFRGRDDGETMKKLRYGKVPNLCRLRRDVPAKLADAIDTALERSRDSRYQSATDMLESLEMVANECGLAPSRTAMRKEIAELCGPIEPPHVDFKKASEGDPSVYRGSDLDLAYFLDQAEMSPTALDTSDADPDDPDFAELLARLD